MIGRAGRAGESAPSPALPGQQSKNKNFISSVNLLFIVLFPYIIPIFVLM
jgi:hypothetical protein